MRDRQGRSRVSRHGLTMTREEERKSIRLDHQGERTRVPDYVLHDWNMRRNAQPQSLTALVLGDPLPGYSALDRK